MRGSMLVAVALAVSACSVARAPRDAPCNYNSDCADALACAGGTCRAECAEDRDCPLAWTCGPSGTPRVRACAPPESALLCAFNSECPEGAACIGGACRAECREDRDCLDGTRCVEGACEAPILTPTDPADAGQAPGDSGPGEPCAAGEVVCRADGLCHDLLTDEAHCGQCGVPCPPDGTCEGGACLCDGERCAPANDRCADAQLVEIGPDGRGAAQGTLAGARPDGEGCGVASIDVFYRLRVTERSVVTAWARGEADVSVSLLSACGEAATDCTYACRDGIGTTHEIGVLEPGERFVMIHALSGGRFRVDVSLIPIGDLPAERLPNGSFDLSAEAGGTASATGCGEGPGRAFYFANCELGAPLVLSTCGSSFATAVEHVHDHPDVPGTCSRAGSCEPAAELSTTVPSDTGGNVVIVRGRGASDTGTIVLRGSR